MILKFKANSKWEKYHKIRYFREKNYLVKGQGKVLYGENCIWQGQFYDFLMMDSQWLKELPEEPNV